MVAMGALDDWTPGRPVPGPVRPDRHGAGAPRDARLSRRPSQLRRLGPAGALPRGRRQPQQARRLLRRALRRERGGVEGVRGGCEGVSGEELADLAMERLTMRRQYFSTSPLRPRSLACTANVT